MPTSAPSTMPAVRRWRASRRGWLASLLGLASLLALVGCAVAPGTPTTASPSPTATPIVVDGVRFQTISDPTFGFHLDIPANMVHNGTQPNASDGGVISAWNGYYPTPDDAIEVYVVTATSGVSPADCAAGAPITIGPGLPGYEQDWFAQPLPTPPPNGAAENWQVSASLVSNGVYISIELLGLPPDATFMQRYGAIWSHMLASFTPGPNTRAGNPCASKGV